MIVLAYSEIHHYNYALIKLMRDSATCRAQVANLATCCGQVADMQPAVLQVADMQPAFSQPVILQPAVHSKEEYKDMYRTMFV